MKRLLIMTMIITAMFTVSASAAVKYNDTYYNVNTKAVSGELMLEARTVFETMGYTINWEPDTKTSIFYNGSNTVNIVSATGDVTVNGTDIQLDVKPVVTDGVTYIPAQLLKNIGVRIKWDFKNAYPLLYSSDYVSAETKTELTTIDETEDEKNTSDKNGKTTDKKIAREETTEETTAAKEGWNPEHNQYYYNGVNVMGTNYIDGKMYNFGNGTLVTGIIRDDTGVKGYNEYGEAYNGFVTLDGKNYYFENGKAYTYPTAINGKMYNFGADGTFTVGWSEADGNKMYFNEFGYPEEGIIEIEGEKYYFINGVMQTGAVVYNDKNYLFNDDGTMVTNKLMGDMYYDLDGVGVKYSQEYIALINKADNILAQTGTSTQAIYSYVADHVKYKFMDQQDWTTMATTAFNSGRGACYNFAACVDILLKRAGYTTRVVRGTGHYTSLHYWNQVYINGVWTNIDACNKYYNATDSYLKSKNYTFDKYEYPVYY